MIKNGSGSVFTGNYWTRQLLKWILGWSILSWACGVWVTPHWRHAVFELSIFCKWCDGISAFLPHSQVNGQRSMITEAFCLLCTLVILWSSWLWFSRRVVDLCICCWAYTSVSCVILSVSIFDFYTARHTTRPFVSSLCGARCVGGLLNTMSEPQLGIPQNKMLQSQFIHEQYMKTFEAPKY